jgi:hypothetical protein
MVRGQQMKSTSAILIAGATGLLAVAAVTPTPAYADLYVLESTATTVSAGAHLASGDSISIPAGSYIRAVLPSGKTQTIKGPFTGSTADIDKGQGANEGVLGWLRGILATGGSREITPGATRGIRREPPALAFSWSTVPVASDATVCVIKGGRVELVRAPASRAERVSIIDSATAARGEAQWEASSATTSWPAALPLRSDATYYVLMADHPQRQLTLRLLEAVPADEDVLVVLQRSGCRPQFEAWVREKLGATAQRR